MINHLLLDILAAMVYESNYHLSKRNLNFGSRSWRYALVVDTGKRIIEAAFVEPGFTNEIESDPFEVSNAETVLEWLKQN